MKRFFLKLFLFLFFTILLYTGILVVFSGDMSKYLFNLSNFRGKSFSYARYSDVETIPNVDILFIGSSHTYRGFDPRIFKEAGYSSYNLGSSSQTPIQSRYLLHRYLEHLRPKVVIIDVYPVIFSLDGVESSLDLIFNDEVGFDTLQLLLDTPKIQLVNAFIASAIIQRIQGVPKKYISTNALDTYIFGGYVERSSKAVTSPLFSPIGALAILPKQKIRLIEITEWLSEQKINYILIQTPVNSGYYGTLSNAEEFDSFFSSLGLYFNYNKLYPGQYDGLLYDHGHLTSEGVAIFNNEVLTLLSNLNLTEWNSFRNQTQ